MFLHHPIDISTWLLGRDIAISEDQETFRNADLDLIYGLLLNQHALRDFRKESFI